MRRVVSVVLCALVAGCASPPPRELPEVDIEPATSWTASEDGSVEPDSVTTLWWTEFGDSALDGLIDEALVNNYDLKAMAAIVDQSAAFARLAGADLFPQVSASVLASRRRNNIIGIIPDQVFTTRANNFGVSLDVAWEIDLWGRIRAGQSAALADLQGSWADMAGVRLSLAANVTRMWFLAVELRLQKELAEETVASFQQSADRVQARYQQGVRSALDVRLALSNLYFAKALLDARREQYDRVKRQLEILLGRYPSSTLEAMSDLPRVTQPVPAGLPSELLIRRPDLLAAERRYAASEKRVSEARRAFFPRISLTGAVGTLAAELEDIVSGDFGVWSLAAGLTQPIFQGGRLRANLANSEAVADLALADYALALLGAFAEVESALFAEQVLAERVVHTANAVEQSEAARVLAERQYDAGIVDIITVLETQRRALDSRSELLRVRRERLDVRIDLHLALGGGFNVNEEWMGFLAQQVAPEMNGAQVGEATVGNSTEGAGTNE